MRSAVLDVGSNSLLLVVAEQRDGNWVPVHETTAVTGLGTGVKNSGLIERDRMAATLLATRRAFDEAKEFGASCRAYGTMALRIAKNASDFLDAAQRQGTPVKVISGEQEALLGVRSVARDPLFSGFETISVIDTGGHSTEVTTARQSEGEISVVASRSVPIGTLGLIERCNWPESPSAQDIFSAAMMVDDQLKDSEDVNETGTAIALGATPSVLVSIRDAVAVWDASKIHGKCLSFEEVGRAVALLCPMTIAERAAMVGMEPGREGTIHAGALILERFMNFLHAEECLVSTRGWRFALLDSEI